MDLQLSGNMKKHDLIYSTVLLIVDIVKKIPRYELLKVSHEITQYVACLIENRISKKYHVDKKQLCIQILTEVYDLNDDEKLLIENQIDFLISINKIRKIPRSKLMYLYIKSFFFNQFRYKKQ
jgi:hypothetical protein